MNSSASSSSSCVVTPGLTCSPTSSSVSETTRPARSIVSISCSLLRTMAIECLQALLDLFVHRLDRRVAVDADDVAVTCTVVLEQRRGLAEVQLEPALHRLGSVV